MIRSASSNRSYRRALGSFQVEVSRACVANSVTRVYVTIRDDGFGILLTSSILKQVVIWHASRTDVMRRMNQAIQIRDKLTDCLIGVINRAILSEG